jgi:hypothetical protein
MNRTKIVSLPYNLKRVKCSKTSLIDLSIRFENHITKTNQQLIYTYQQRIDSLNVAAKISSSDIAFATIKLTQFQ